MILTKGQAGRDMLFPYSNARLEIAAVSGYSISVIALHPGGGRDGDKSERFQENQNSQPNQGCANEGKEHKSEGMEPQNGDDFDEQTQGDQGAQNLQKPPLAHSRQFHWAGFQNFSWLRFATSCAMSWQERQDT